MKKRSKKRAQDNHFSLRCLERLGYIPNKNQIIDDIQTGKLQFLDRESNRITRWLWIDPLTKKECIIPYDKERKQVITVMFKWKEEELDGNKTRRKE